MYLLGQAVEADKESVIENLISETSWEDFICNVSLDTLSIATFLRDCGRLDLPSLSLKSLGDYFKLNTENMHDAKVDAILTWQVYQKLQQLI